MSRTMLAAVAAITLTPLAAPAITLEPDRSYTFADVLNPDEVLSYSFEVSAALNIANFVVTATDTNGGADIGETTFSYYVVMDDGFDTIVSSSGIIGDPDATGAGMSFVSGWGPYAAGDMFEFMFKENIVDAVSIGLSFQTTAIEGEPEPVPLPAAGGLLLLALGGLAWRNFRLPQQVE